MFHKLSIVWNYDVANVHVLHWTNMNILLHDLYRMTFEEVTLKYYTILCRDLEKCFYGLSADRIDHKLLECANKLLFKVTSITISGINSNQISAWISVCFHNLPIVQISHFIAPILILPTNVFVWVGVLQRISKVIHPKYHKHFMEAAQHSISGQTKNGW